jgi:peroxiredoxin
MRRITWIASVVTGAAFLAAPALAQDAKPEKPAPTKQEKPHAKQGEKKDAKSAESTGGETKASMGGAEVGKAAPAFSLTGTDGKTYKLADFKDKIVVIEWINRECPVCKAQMPVMKETSAALQKKGVVWLAIDSTAAHTTKDNAEHVKKEGLAYPILDDSAGTVGHAYGAKSTPTMFVINKGTVAYSGAAVQEKEGSRNYVSEAVEALLAGKEVPTPTTKAYGCSVKYKQ